jgi:KDO2-lipid IV(A) lauroyltransferase
MIRLVRALPLNAGLRLGIALGTLFRLVAKSRYKRALSNLELAYGNELTAKEREKIAKECFNSFGMALIESIKFGAISQEELESRIVVQGYEGLQEILSHGKGVILAGGHLGNFEVAGRWFTARGHSLLALARDNRDPATTEMMKNLRKDMGITAISIRSALRPIYQQLKANQCVGIICDQNAADVFVPFFGQPTGTADGPARISLKTGAPLLCFSCTRTGLGTYLARSWDIIWPESTGDADADVRRMMTQVNTSYERMIRATPEQWLWFHDRWKSARQAGMLDGSEPASQVEATQS